MVGIFYVIPVEYLICVQTLQGVVSNYGSLVSELGLKLTEPLASLIDVTSALRFFLGFFEAGLFPGIAFYLSW